MEIRDSEFKSSIAIKTMFYTCAIGMPIPMPWEAVLPYEYSRTGYGSAKSSIFTVGCPRIKVFPNQNCIPVVFWLKFLIKK